MCADLVEIAVRKRSFQLDRKYLPGRTGNPQLNRLLRNPYIFVNDLLRNPYARPTITVPKSGIVYRRGCQLRITVSEGLFYRNASTLVRAESSARTYSVPQTVRCILRDAFEHSTVIKAVKLNKRMKEVDTDLFRNSPVRMVICPNMSPNIDRLLTSVNRSRTVVLPDGIWLAAQWDDWNFRRQVTMVVPQDVREIRYLPVYKTINLSGVRVLPGS